MLAAMIAGAIVLYTLYAIFASHAAGKIDASLSTVVINGIGAVLPLLFYMAAKTSHAKGMLTGSKLGWVYSLLAGACIAAFAVLLLKIFQKGDLAYVVPIIYGGTLVLSAVAGWLFFSAKFSAIELIGVSLIAIGVACVTASKLA